MIKRLTCSATLLAMCSSGSLLASEANLINYYVLNGVGETDPSKILDSTVSEGGWSEWRQKVESMLTGVSYYPTQWQTSVALDNNTMATGRYRLNAAESESLSDTLSKATSMHFDVLIGYPSTAVDCMDAASKVATKNSSLKNLNKINCVGGGEDIQPTTFSRNGEFFSGKELDYYSYPEHYVQSTAAYGFNLYWLIYDFEKEFGGVHTISCPTTLEPGFEYTLAFVRSSHGCIENDTNASGRDGIHYPAISHYKEIRKYTDVTLSPTQIDTDVEMGLAGTQKYKEEHRKYDLVDGFVPVITSGITVFVPGKIKKYTSGWIEDYSEDAVFQTAMFSNVKGGVKVALYCDNKAALSFNTTFRSSSGAVLSSKSDLLGESDLATIRGLCGRDSVMELRLENVKASDQILASDGSLAHADFIWSGTGNASNYNLDYIKHYDRYLNTGLIDQLNILEEYSNVLTGTNTVDFLAAAQLHSRKLKDQLERFKTANSIEVDWNVYFDGNDLFKPSIDSNVSFPYESYVNRWNIEHYPNDMQPSTRIRQITGAYAMFMNGGSDYYPYLCEYKNAWKAATDYMTLADNFVSLLAGTQYESTANLTLGEWNKRTNSSEFLYQVEHDLIMNPYVAAVCEPTAEDDL